MKNTKKDDEVAISVKNVSKAFKLPHEKQNSIKGLFVNMFRGKQSYENQQALKDISFEVKKGEFFGIVGRNGSGKSTLLKLISGIYTPDSGSIHINGKLTPFIELGVGFSPELTGRENVFLNGALLGFSNKEMEAMYDEIVEFAELGRFMDQKLKNYSSGMQVRLAFSIAIRANTDILVLDEVLAVGDEAFQRKCYDFFSKLKKQKKTVVLVTHDMNSVQRFCDSAILINDSVKQLQGAPSKVAAKYSILNLETSTGKKRKKESHIGNGKAHIKITTENASNRQQNIFTPNEKLILKINVKVKDDLIDPRVGIVIQDINDNFVFATNTLVEKVSVPVMKKGSQFEVRFEMMNIFTDGRYMISGAIASNFDEMIYDRIEKACNFTSGGWRLKHPIVHPPHKISFQKK